MSLVDRCITCDRRLPPRGGPECEECAFARHYPDWRLTYEYGRWCAVHKDFDASWEGEEDGWVGNGLSTEARFIVDLLAEIDALMEEHPHFKSETGKGTDHEAH